VWRTLLIYAHIPSALTAIRTDAGHFTSESEIGEAPLSRQSLITQGVVHGTDLTVVPTCDGVTFNPEQATIKWLEDWHRIPFRFSASASRAGQPLNGEINIFASFAVNIATIPFTLVCREHGAISTLPADTRGAADNQPSIERTATIYNSIFTSYSHQDTAVVLACRNVYEALGNSVLIDQNLRSGQVFTDALMEMIDASDIFQLYWSARSAESDYVEKEWRYALEHTKGKGFIRPVYWEQPLVTPPIELNDLHFTYMPLPSFDALGPGAIEEDHFAALPPSPVSGTIERPKRRSILGKLRRRY
jgi:hypothetical protein